MSYDWHAAFQVSTEGQAGDLARQEGAFSEVVNLYGRLKLLSQVQVVDPSSSWTKERTHYRQLVHRAQGISPYTQELIDPELCRLRRLGILNPRLNSGVLEILPLGSFSLQFRFALEEPFISKDDASFYPHDNPLRKEWAFKVPMVGGSGWKGNLRAAMRWQNDGQENNDLRLLFGPPRPEGVVSDEYFQAGRLLFYPTYFDAIELEMLNPHDRESGGGRDPFNLECAPVGAHGVFSLLYVPFDRAGWPWDECKAEIGAHLKRIAKGLQAMFRTLGFSAKRTSGFGLAAEGVEGIEGKGKGVLMIHAETFREKGESKVEPVSSDRIGPPSPPEGLAEFMVNGEFPILQKGEVNAQEWGNSKKTRYKRVRDAYLAWKTALTAWEQRVGDTELGMLNTSQAHPSLQALAFASFAELVSVADDAVRLLEVSHE